VFPTFSGRGATRGRKRRKDAPGGGEEKRKKKRRRVALKFQRYSGNSPDQRKGKKKTGRGAK